MNNSIYLSRKKIYLERGSDVLPNDYLLNLLQNIERLGFTFSPELVEVTRTLSVAQLKAFYPQLIADLKTLVGAYVIFDPMYPNFPEQVKQASEEELYSNAFWHYMGDALGVRLLPHYEKHKREALQDVPSLKVIGLGSKEDFDSILTRLLNAKTSISEADKQIVLWFVDAYGEGVMKLVPPAIPSKENVALFVGALLKKDVDVAVFVQTYVKTATDVLRIATALSGGDVSLAANTKFKSLPKRIRRLLLQMLEQSGNITEDMLRYKNRWKRLGERLHPFEYKTNFPKCYEAFDCIRNDKPFQTFYGSVEKALLRKDTTSLIQLLKARPGELARRLDKLIRDSADAREVLNAFGPVAGAVSTPVLLQVINHFKERNTPRALRTFFPKGDVGRVRAIDNKLPPIAAELCEQVVDICEGALIERFRKYAPLGKVYVDEALKNYTVPLAMRSASKALKTISRGSKIPLPVGDTLRFFIYWKDGHDRTDLDLSVLALDTDSKFTTTIAYYNLKDFGGYHSGDITSAPDGASEFIDVEIPKFVEKGVRYVLMCVNSFTNQPYCDLPICFAGFMMRQHPDSGEVYEPVTVENKFDLTANTKMAIPLIVDLQERNIIWTDLGLRDQPSENNNVHNNLSSLTILNISMTSVPKPTLYDLFMLHVKARGERTFDIDEANSIFAEHQGIQPTDIDKIVADFL
ncbi:TerD family protein [Chryseolinea lacunae]|uniref:TerD family protein n=1 Tax=Chryseolinea lacunae TaxID=2801331 RepID=A0ABS1KJY4_9BACT|nr:TerD family protein [Chryseolinea lacunae]MBL0739764.1 TerD family protein [Chryseolinea lacunae]